MSRSTGRRDGSEPRPRSAGGRGGAGGRATRTGPAPRPAAGPAGDAEVLGLAGVPALVIDRGGAVLGANRPFLALTSYAPGELDGHPASAVIGGLPPPGEAGPAEGRCTRKDGAVLPVEITRLPPGAGGQSVVALREVAELHKLREKALQRTKEINAFGALARSVSRSTDIDAIAREAVALMIEVLGADAAWVYVLDEPSGELVLRASRGGPGPFFADVERLRPHQQLCGRVAASGRPALVKHATEDPRVDQERFRSAGIESVAGVPIASTGQVLGVLGMAARRAASFTSMDMKLALTLADHIGIAMENAKLVARLTEKVKQIGLIGEVGGIVTSSLSIGTVFRLLATETKKLVDYDRASVNLFDETGRKMHIFALETAMHTRLTRGVKAPVAGTSSGWAAANNRPWINRDLARETAFPLDERLFREGIRSTISIPLYHGRTLGAFNLDSTAPGAYSERDLEILVPIARHIAVAIENALLFEEINRDRKEWEKTFDAITDLVWIQGRDGRLLRANQAVLARTGLAYREIAGEAVDALLRRLGVDPCAFPCRRPEDCGTPRSAELEGLEGEILHAWSYPLLDEEGRQYGLVTYCKDVTERRKLEEQIVRSSRLASLGTLAAGVAHEINNPLGIIAGYTEALIDRARDGRLGAVAEFADFPPYLETIHREIFRCKNILGGLLDFARPAGWNPREIEINDLLKEVLLLVRHQADREGRRIELALAPGLPRLRGEAGQLRQLFMNLIINSLYFTPREGRVTVRTSPARGGGVAVAVADEGCGIAKDNLHKVFDPFFTTKPATEGTGLGLAICHRIAEEHGGTIEVESAPGSGAVFTVALRERGR